MSAEAVAKVSALANGRILLNGKSASLAELDTALGKVKATGGVVWYYREAAAAEPPPEAMEVIKLVVKHSLPISMSTKPDFSDTVGPDGRSKRREP